MSKRQSRLQRQQLRFEAGFSLLEMLAVLLCLTLFMAISIPGYQRIIENRELKLAANQLLADLRECQALANRDGRPIRISLQQTTYLIEGPGVNKRVQLPSSVRITETRIGLSKNTIEFNEKGHPAGGGSIVVKTTTGKSIKLTLHLHSGQIQLVEGEL